MKTKKYLGRGIHKERVLKSLKDGKLKNMLKIINEDKDLDVQIRNNYFNIYYEGGNIAKINSENSIEFNENYFLTDDKKAKKEKLIKKFKDGEYKEFFSDAKKVMIKWGVQEKAERNEQHYLSINNRNKKTDYTIIDIEYQVSTESLFACTYIPRGKKKPKKPRFDIIAINKKGELCVIELKKGLKALGNTSGLKEHWDCYEQSINNNYKPFVDEMNNILKQKQEFGIIKNDKLLIKFDEPKFMFAFTCHPKEGDCELQINKFKEKLDKEKLDDIKTIIIKEDSFELKD